MSVARPRSLAGGAAPARSKAVVRGKLASLLVERLCEQYGRGCVALMRCTAHTHGVRGFTGADAATRHLAAPRARPPARAG